MVFVTEAHFLLVSSFSFRDCFSPRVVVSRPAVKPIYRSKAYFIQEINTVLLKKGLEICGW